MRLLSCYIAGFGKFANQQFDLSRDLVVIKQDNGWGKTTLATFLKCMLFGMEASRGKAVEASDRVRYEPWQGGAYGGSLLFTVGGRQYRIERSFGKTPAQDVVRLYDKNNMQCFDFGDKAERLGEAILGVNAESYMRSAYVPQGEIETGGLPDDMKTRLLALLSTGGKGETSAERAIEALDKADRALRSRRSPHNGKLDLIDTRLQEITAQKAECERDKQAAQSMRGALAQKKREIEACVREIAKWSSALERLTQKSAQEAVQKSARELQRRLLDVQAELTKLNEFFGANDPTTLNVEGLQNAVTKFYEQKQRLVELENRISDIQGQAKALAELKTRAEACEKVLDSYDAILEKKYGKKGNRRAKKGKRIKPPINKTVISVLTASIVVALAGAILVEVVPYVAYAMLGAGVLAMIISFLLILPRREKVPQEAKAADDMQDEISVRYDETYAELRELERQIAEYPEGLEEEYAALTAEYAELKPAIAAQENAVCVFLQNFRFKEIYDYRASLGELKDKIEAHAKYRAECAQIEERLREYPPEALRAEETGQQNQAQNMPQTGDVSSIKAQKTAWEERKDELMQDYASTLSRIEQIEARADKSLLISEEERLTEEKVRLEKRHRAILAAKQFLERARANMAARYLEPVERGCRQYLQFLGGRNALRFTAEGAPYCEENGQLKTLAYYSVGSKELVGLCTRIALVDAVYTKERPTLILDDPFVNFDDGTTEKAKRLVKELSKKYQIVYLTCKSERQI